MEHVDKTYFELIKNIKQKILTAQQKAVLAINREMILLYWEIGNSILEKQNVQGWGTKIIDSISKDIKKSFPDVKGFSVRNLKYMRKFAIEYPDIEFVQRSVAQLPWSHNLILIEKVPDNNIREWYMQKTFENGWSRDVLIHQIESDLYKRQNAENKTTNFELTLPNPQSDLAVQTLKDPYIFDFITTTEKVLEKDIEEQLVKNITSFLLELGAGFAFVGRQFHLEVSNTDFYIDLLFYHIKLNCYVAIELKTGDFKPEYAGKINFYLSALDSQVKSDDDNPSIGIILCKGKNKTIAEYALKDMSKPIGVAEYKLVEAIPDDLKPNLPTIEDLEKSLDIPEE